MVRDKANIIVDEQIMRLRDEILDEIQSSPTWRPPEYVVMGPEIPMDMVAYGIAMVRVAHSTRWN